MPSTTSSIQGLSRDLAVLHDRPVGLMRDAVAIERSAIEQPAVERAAVERAALERAAAVERALRRYDRVEVEAVCRHLVGDLVGDPRTDGAHARGRAR